MKKVRATCKDDFMDTLAFAFISVMFKGKIGFHGLLERSQNRSHEFTLDFLFFFFWLFFFLFFNDRLFHPLFFFLIQVSKIDKK
jgi:hypothetical protein